MTFIDWSDSEGIVALLIEFVADERNECLRDAKRQQFLADLLVDLRAFEQQFATVSGTNAINELRTIYNSIDPEFRSDPAMVHFKDCIEELERVDNRGTS